jgi:hypothetical protein
VDRRDAENEIFTLRKKTGLAMQAGDIEEVNRLQTRIAELQKQTGAGTGIERKSHDRGNETGSEYGD